MSLSCLMSDCKGVLSWLNQPSLSDGMDENGLWPKAKHYDDYDFLEVPNTTSIKLSQSLDNQRQARHTALWLITAHHHVCGIMVIFISGHFNFTHFQFSLLISRLWFMRNLMHQWRIFIRNATFCCFSFWMVVHSKEWLNMITTKK